LFTFFWCKFCHINFLCSHINHSVSQKHQVLNLFSACQICGSGSCSATHSRTDLKRRHRSVSCPARLAPCPRHLRGGQADIGTSHRLTHLNLRDILIHIKLKDNLFLHYVAQFCTGLNVKCYAKQTLKQVQGDKFLVQNSAKIGTKVQE